MNWVKNASSFGRDKCLSLHTDNRKKDILVLWEGATDVLNNTKITAEAKNSINIKNNPRNFLLLKSTVQHCQQFFSVLITGKSIKSEQKPLK